uniref:DNA-directed RNA polymerase n=1 Tax=viral metagenome TaxID=1070528 RepID=A0A6C0HI36_9ZZZZ
MSRTKKDILPLNEEEENESDASDIESEEDEEKKPESDDENSVDDEEEEKDEELLLEREADKKMMEDFVSDNDASDVDDEDDEYEDELQKFKDYQVISSLEKQHPEIMQVNYEEVLLLSKVVRNVRGEIIDPLHTTLPILTKYEKARVIGSRAEQINRGAAPSIPVDESIIDGRIIAIMEFENKSIPFIIARPLPSGGIEYWKVNDLEVL